MIRFDKKELIGAEGVYHASEMRVRFQDVDAAGIVFFARMFDYVHLGYEEFLHSAGHPLPEVIKDKRWAAPLRHAEADYMAPARFGDTLNVELVAAHVEESEITLGWRLRAQGSSGGAAVAVVQTVHTFVTLPAFTRTTVPIEIAERLTPAVSAAR